MPECFWKKYFAKNVFQGCVCTSAHPMMFVGKSLLSPRTWFVTCPYVYNFLSLVHLTTYQVPVSAAKFVVHVIVNICTVLNYYLSEILSALTDSRVTVHRLGVSDATWTGPGFLAETSQNQQYHEGEHCANCLLLGAAEKRRHERYTLGIVSHSLKQFLVVSSLFKIYV